MAGVLIGHPQILFSVSNSLTEAVAWILVCQGILAPKIIVIKYFPEVANPSYGDCRPRHALGMTVCSSFSE
jgi:hypothetical protein